MPEKNSLFFNYFYADKRDVAQSKKQQPINIIIIYN